MSKLQQLLRQKVTPTPNPDMQKRFHQQGSSLFKCPKCRQKVLHFTLATSLILLLILLRTPHQHSSPLLEHWVNSQITLSQQLDSFILEDTQYELDFDTTLDNNS